MNNSTDVNTVPKWIQDIFEAAENEATLKGSRSIKFPEKYRVAFKSFLEKTKETLKKNFTIDGLQQEIEKENNQYVSLAKDNIIINGFNGSSDSTKYILHNLSEMVMLSVSINIKSNMQKAMKATVETKNRIIKNAINGTVKVKDTIVDTSVKAVSFVKDTVKENVDNVKTFTNSVKDNVEKKVEKMASVVTEAVKNVPIKEDIQYFAYTKQKFTETFNNAKVKMQNSRICKIGTNVVNKFRGVFNTIKAEISMVDFDSFSEKENEYVAPTVTFEPEVIQAKKENAFDQNFFKKAVAPSKVIKKEEKPFISSRADRVVNRKDFAEETQVKGLSEEIFFLKGEMDGLNSKVDGLKVRVEELTKRLNSLMINQPRTVGPKTRTYNRSTPKGNTTNTALEEARLRRKRALEASLPQQPDLNENRGFAV